MTNLDAQRWLIKASLAATAVIFTLFLVGPSVGLPMRWDQALRIVEIVLPVFMGYLGSMTLVIFKRRRVARRPATSSPLLPLIVKGPMVVFAVAVLAIVGGFILSNRASAPPGSGMGLDQVSAALSAALGLLTVTTNTVMSFLSE